MNSANDFAYKGQPSKLGKELKPGSSAKVKVAAIHPRNQWASIATEADRMGKPKVKARSL